MSAPCPTCRHYVIHIHELGQVITALRIGATRHRGLHSRLMNHVRVTRRIRALLDRHRRDDGCDQRRTAIRELADHLTDHAEKRAA